MATKLIGACENLCASCPRREFESDKPDSNLEETVACFPVREALVWMDEIDFIDPNDYQADFQRIAESLGISSLHAAALVQCVVSRVKPTCENRT